MTNNNQSTTSKGYVKTISIIHFGLVAGLLAFGALTFFQTEIAETSGINQDDPMIYIAPLIGMVGLFASKAIFKRLLDSSKTADTLQKKLAGHQTASLIQWALIEGPHF